MVEIVQRLPEPAVIAGPLQKSFISEPAPDVVNNS